MNDTPTRDEVREADDILEQFDDGIARITLNRPDQLNSLTASLCAAFNRALTPRVPQLEA